VVSVRLFRYFRYGVLGMVDQPMQPVKMLIQPHSFHAKQSAEHIRAIYARDRALIATQPTRANDGGV